MKPDDMPFMSTSSLYTDSNYMHCSKNKDLFLQVSNTTCLTVLQFCNDKNFSFRFHVSCRGTHRFRYKSSKW